ncbi:hypothetical protein M413DRAFT_285502 [Hebeloma cylindrosporum]|uniref:F-box domain-containing protein n=1 Tax=Hebeloma cylindrosporum TaxID=76867 RepID=A0A0C3BIU5_HEBCY|nr:hypothetical protein M413DRAFT_285502 [Hebeloma cylindrosporum h7]
MLAAVKSAVLAVFNRSGLWQPARVQPEAREPSPPPRPPVGLCEFPLELLTMILEELDWRDVLRVRMVCKTLQGVSKTRSVWLNLCRPHLSPTATAPQTLHLERPIKLYTSYDLEFLFLRLKSADAGWRTEDNSPARKREIVTTKPAKFMYLVEGGRWLLVASATGCITYFDLDSSTPTESVLIPDQFDLRLPDVDQGNPFAEAKVVMATDRDSDSAFLAFNLVVSFSLTRTPPPDPKAQCVQIWRVELAVDDQKRGIGLTAEFLASFPLESSVRGIFCQSLRGPHLALSLLSVGRENCQLTFIIDWKQANGDQTNYPRRLLHPPYGKNPEAIHILPGNKLFTVAPQGVMVFDYIDIPETTSLPPVDFTDATAMPLWRVRGLGIHLGLQSSSISKPFFCSHSIRFSIRGRDTVHGVIIDYPYNEGPTEPLGRIVTLIEKLNIKMKLYEYYGYSKATVLCGRIGTYLFNYPWPDEQNDGPLPTPLHREGTPESWNFGPFLDEQSGRIVVSAHKKESHDIWDLALLYK